jgi:outer membrane receptor for Fe3+-dicitrate
MNLGMFVQDQWTIKRLTITPGIRFDYINAYNPAQPFAAGVYTPEFRFAEVDNVPNWKDISPAYRRCL